MTDSTMIQNKWLICSLILGLCEGIEKNVVSFDTAGKLLFWPFSMKTLEEKSYDQDLINLLHQASELEDVFEIANDGFQEAVSKLKKDTFEYMNHLDPNFITEKRWLNSVIS